MIVKIGNLFESSTQTLVNTINCVGVMGKGIALEFKKRYPEMFREYESLCSKGLIIPGVPYYYNDLSGASILNFPTKDHWRSPSKLSYIISGLKWFRENYGSLGIKSIAFPPLGCGNGGLSWDIVGPIMYLMLNDLPIEIEVYAPYGTSSEKITSKFLSENAIESKEDIIGNKNMKFNKYWLLILYVVQKLNHDKYSLNVGRVIFQKICYVLTRSGIPTGFNFGKGSYGPYSSEVHDAITVLSNAGLMTERKLNRMVETVVSPDFDILQYQFTDGEIKKANEAFDLLSRIRSTDQAEMITTVLFSYDELFKKKGVDITDDQIREHVMSWKPRWENIKSDEVISTIWDLAILGVIDIQPSVNITDEHIEIF